MYRKQGSHECFYTYKNDKQGPGDERKSHGKNGFLLMESRENRSVHVLLGHVNVSLGRLYRPKDQKRAKRTVLHKQLSIYTLRHQENLPKKSQGALGRIFTCSQKHFTKKIYYSIYI